MQGIELGFANRRTCSPSLRAMPRCPSNLISWSQPGPDGGLSARAGWHGRMKPGGLERVRMGRETRHPDRRLVFHVEPKREPVAGKAITRDLPPRLPIISQTVPKAP